MKHLITLAALLFAGLAFCEEPIQLRITFSSNAETTQSNTATVANGDTLEMVFANGTKYQVIASVLDENKIMLDGKIFRTQGTQSMLIGEPKLVTDIGVSASIEVGDESGETYSIEVIAHR